MWEQGLCVTVANVDPMARGDREIAALVGEVFERDANPVVIGRRDGASIRLQHASVSREHVRLERRDGVVAVRNLSSHGTTAVNGMALDHGAEVLVDGTVTWIQTGAVLLRLSPVNRTERWETPIRPPERESTGLLSIELFGDTSRGEARMGGTPFHLAPMPLMLLALLAERPGQIYAQSELALELSPEGGNPQLEPKIHHVRSALTAVLVADLAVLDRVRNALRRADPTLAVDELHDASDVARRLVRSHRGRGYSLALSPADVSVVRHRR
jgi:pSer/pThr/pTyr-binding forkhead associated (FHA) protein